MLIASTTLPTVAILSPSPVLTSTVPALSPVVTLLIVPVTTFNPLVPSVVIVVPSVLTFKPSVPTSKDLSAGFTVTLLLASFSKPLPRFTLYFTVDVLPSALSTVTDVPSPLTKFTVSYGFTKSTAAPSPCRFQPAFNTSPTVAALFGLIYWSPSLFVVFGAA